MIVALCGPEATGKSTLAGALARARGLPVLEDPRAAIGFSGYATPYEAARALPYWEDLLDAQLERERAAADGVFDGCAVDAWVSVLRWSWNALPPRRVDEIEERCRAAAARYDHVVVLPPIQRAPFASHRFLDARNAARIHRLTLATLADWRPAGPTTLLPDLPEGERAERVLADLGAAPGRAPAQGAKSG